MALPTAAEVQTMDFVSRGLPFVDVPVSATDTSTLDYVSRGLPFLTTAQQAVVTLALPFRQLVWLNPRGPLQPSTSLSDGYWQNPSLYSISQKGYLLIAERVLGVITLSERPLGGILLSERVRDSVLLTDQPLGIPHVNERTLGEEIETEG